MYYFRNKKSGIFTNTRIVFLVFLSIYFSFFTFLLDGVYSQEVSISGFGGVNTDMHGVGLKDNQPETRRSPFRNWFPGVEPIREVVNETITEIIEDYFPRFDISRFNLQGVIWSISDSRAIINSKIYRIGEEINGAKIIKIDKKGVTLQHRKEEYVLFIPEVIKMEVANETYGQEDSYGTDVYYGDEYGSQEESDVYGVPEEYF